MKLFFFFFNFSGRVLLGHLSGLEVCVDQHGLRLIEIHLLCFLSARLKVSNTHSAHENILKAIEFDGGFMIVLATLKGTDQVR